MVNLLAATLVVLTGAYLTGLGAVALLAPARAARFLPYATGNLRLVAVASLLFGGFVLASVILSSSA